MPASRNSRTSRFASACDEPDAREVRHRLDVGVLEDVAQHGERPVARGAARTEGHRDEGRVRLGEPVDRATEGERRGIGARREQLERDRRARSDSPRPPSSEPVPAMVAPA